MKTERVESDECHKGKIGRVPYEIREQFNHRLRNGDKGKALLDWVNAQPETKKVLDEEFGGQPVTKQNLSDWRRTGYPEWLRKQEALAETRRILEDAGDVLKVGTASLPDNVAVLLGVRLSMLMSKLGQQGADPENELRLLHRLTQDISMLRRNNQGAQWVGIENRRVALLEERHGRKQVEQFLKWYENPAVRATLQETNMSYQDKIDMLGQEMFGDYWNPEWRPRKEFPPGQTNDPPLMVRMREEEERKKKAEAEKPQAAAAAEHGVHPLGCSPAGAAAAAENCKLENHGVKPGQAQSNLQDEAVDSHEPTAAAESCKLGAQPKAQEHGVHPSGCSPEGAAEPNVKPGQGQSNLQDEAVDSHGQAAPHPGPLPKGDGESSGSQRCDSDPNLSTSLPLPGGEGRGEGDLPQTLKHARHAKGKGESSGDERALKVEPQPDTPAPSSNLQPATCLPAVASTPRNTTTTEDGSAKAGNLLAAPKRSEGGQPAAPAAAAPEDSDEFVYDPDCDSPEWYQEFLWRSAKNFKALHPGKD